MLMTQRRVTETNQLSTVVDALQLGKKSGILTVERGEGGTFEEGAITLVNGQVVNAAIGPYRGNDATTKLFSWQACRFSFAPMQPEQAGAVQGWGSMPGLQIEKMGNGNHAPDSFNGAQQMYRAVQDNGNSRPSAAYSHDTLDTILLALDRQGFSRTHRRLFLLIDGRRSVEELAALISRTPDETMSLLANLEQAGFIQL